MSDATKIAAEGSKLTLTDGRVVQVRFGMRELARLEDRFGSIQGVQDALATGKTFGSTVAVLAIGAGREGISEDDLYDLLDPALFPTYAEVIFAAFGEAFPDQAGSGNDQAEAKTDSPGPTTTTSPSSSSAAPNGSSGT